MKHSVPTIFNDFNRELIGFAKSTSFFNFFSLQNTEISLLRRSDVKEVKCLYNCKNGRKMIENYCFENSSIRK